MRSWNLRTLDVAPRRPVVLDSHSEGRSIAIHLSPGDRLDEHHVHERAWLVVIEGALELEAAGHTHHADVGCVAIFDPREDHEVRAVTESRLLLVLAPWPGEGRNPDLNA
jgi:quercetin dioxygenase-like cupin family protein